MKISYSDLKVYKICPLQYRWSRLGGYPKTVDVNEGKKRQFIGHLLQRMVEQFYRHEWWKTPKQALANFRIEVGLSAQGVMKRENVVWNVGEYDHWLQVAQDAIPTILETIKREKLVGARNYAELNVTIPIESHEVWGRVDFVILRGAGSNLILDGKGGGTYGRHTDKDQLIMYDLGIQTRLLTAADKFGFWWFRHGKIQWHKISNDLRDKFKQESLAAIQGIGNLAFEPTPGSHCRLCDFRLGCEAGMKEMAKTTTQIPDLELPGNASLISL